MEFLRVPGAHHCADAPQSSRVCGAEACPAFAVLILRTSVALVLVQIESTDVRYTYHGILLASGSLLRLYHRRTPDERLFCCFFAL